MFKLFTFILVLGVWGLCHCAPKEYKKESYKKESNSKHYIELPVHSKSDTEIIKTESKGDGHETHVEVDGGVLPVYILFKTQSSPVYVKQEHKGTKGSEQKTSSKDEPHKLTHEVKKPVMQEIIEVIKPYRKVIQVIEPVQEEVLTKVHKGERKDHKEEEYKKKDDHDEDDHKYEDDKKYEDKKYDEKKYEDKKYGHKMYEDKKDDDKKYKEKKYESKKYDSKKSDRVMKLAIYDDKMEKARLENNKMIETLMQKYQD